jgi:hypothetical protein
MTVAVAGAVRGRPSVSTLQDSLARARQVNGDLRLELRAQRHESQLFAERIRHASRELRRAVVLDRMDVVDQVAGELGYHADRRARQLGSSVL